jgi:hypothetical protein
MASSAMSSAHAEPALQGARGAAQVVQAEIELTCLGAARGARAEVRGPRSKRYHDGTRQSVPAYMENPSSSNLVDPLHL